MSVPVPPLTPSKVIPSADLKAQKLKQLTPLKGFITKFSNSVQKDIDVESKKPYPDRKVVNKSNTTVKKLYEKLSTINEIVSEICAINLACEDDPESEEYETFTNEMMEFDLDRSTLIDDLHSQLEILNLKLPNTTSTSSNPIAGSSTAHAIDDAGADDDDVKPCAVQIKAKLPSIKIPDFDGTLLKWNEFWDLFDTHVHKANLSDSSKFVILKSHLKGKALQKIEGIECSNAGYMHAVNIIFEHYNVPHKIVESIHRSLLVLKKPSYNLNEIENFSDQLVAYSRLLLSNGINLKENNILITIILEKLPHEILTSLVKAEGDISYTLEMIIEQLKEAVTILRIKQDFQPTKSDSAPPPTGIFHTDSRKNPNQYPYQGQQKPWSQNPHSGSSGAGGYKPNQKPPDNYNSCWFCLKSNHRSKDCRLYPDPLSRLKRAKELKLCTNCLKKDCHISRCQSKYSCKICSKRHNTLLHLSKDSNISTYYINAPHSEGMNMSS